MTQLRKKLAKPIRAQQQRSNFLPNFSITSHAFQALN
jgi:hypothetical protein